MISRSVKLLELLRRQRPDGASYSALVSFDEATPTTIRLTREEHDDLEAAQAAGVRFIVTLHAIDTTSEGGTT